MTTSNDDQTMQLPEFDATTPLPTIPDAVPDATVEMPTSDPLAVFRDEPNTQMPSEPAPAGGFTGAGARTAFDPASTGESVPLPTRPGLAWALRLVSGGASGAAGVVAAPGYQGIRARRGALPLGPPASVTCPRHPAGACASAPSPGRSWCAWSARS